MLLAWVLLDLLVSLCIVVLIRWAFKRHHAHQLFKKYGIQGPAPSFLSGNLFELNRTHPNDAVSRWIKQYGNVFGYFMGDQPFLIINDLDLLKQIFIKDHLTFVNRPGLVFDIKPLDMTMVLLKDRRWKEVRSILTPTFSSAKMKLIFNVVSKKVDITVDLISKKAEANEIFDIYELLQRLTLDVIADCSLAMKSHCQENPNDSFLKLAQGFVRSLNNPVLITAQILTFLNGFLKFAAYYVSSGLMIRRITEHINHVLECRSRNPGIRSMDFLQLMLDRQAESGKEGIPVMTNLEIAANAFVFLLAGFETTSTAIAFTFYVLVTHPDIQQRLYKEINEAEDSSYHSIQNCQYLDQVLNETLRLYPPVTHLTTRCCDKDYQIGSLVIPKGANVQSPVWDIHHDPAHWPDPWTFDPDRFSPENKSSINSAAFQPFGLGPRNCVGSRFAQLEAKLAIFRLLKKFRFDRCEKTENQIKIRKNPLVSQPQNGVWVRAVSRDTVI